MGQLSSQYAPLLIAGIFFAIAIVFFIASIVIKIVKKAIKAKAKAALVGAVVGGVAKGKKKKNADNAQEAVALCSHQRYLYPAHHGCILSRPRLRFLSRQAASRHQPTCPTEPPICLFALVYLLRFCPDMNDPFYSSILPSNKFCPLSISVSLL